MPGKKILPPLSATQPSARATIADVAREAGVSKATVSRFLNHRERLLTPDIAARVEVAIAALNFSPSPMAQALKRGRSRLIGLVVADVSNPFSVAVLRGAEKACREAGYLLMLFNLGNDSQRESEAIEALTAYQVEGLILNTLGRDAGAAAEAARHGKPVVLVDRRHQDMQADFVSLDNAGAVRLGARHLVEAGYRELLFVSEPLKDVSSRMERESAFRNFIGESAADTPGLAGHTFESAADDTQGLDQALRDLRQRAGDRLPGVVSSNAVVTLRVVAAMARLGWRFGSEVGLVGFDETEWSPYVGPGLSTIAQPTDELGQLAAGCLIERLKGLDLPPRQILLSGRLVPRGSSVPDRTA
ncbi:LacI family DNA-binding transcriptional regulator [Polaromonas sp. JS666]|uniref:LacI family DNA-binding transcriptional regulator n=1 Tax=Polaromonas sp. (strain JS666 / ATCC BAA-500) TaxID=296591 RepID=UPI0000464630|nr:LacI family DNA-binding transcriptional regulator [Polaromonas sp. JS666]ABE43674.1 transcriptional regulator, LacI family [Polaromonas sp. JS666]